MKRYLLTAHYDGDKQPLWDKLKALAADGSTFFLVVPATPTSSDGLTWTESEAYQAGKQRLDSTLGEMRGAGLNADGAVLNYSLEAAIEEALKSGNYDELILSTPPEGEARSSFEQYVKRIRMYSNIPILFAVNDNAQEIERA